MTLTKNSETREHLQIQVAIGSLARHFYQQRRAAIFHLVRGKRLSYNFVMCLCSLDPRAVNNHPSVQPLAHSRSTLSSLSVCMFCVLSHLLDDRVAELNFSLVITFWLFYGFVCCSNRSFTFLLVALKINVPVRNLSILKHHVVNYYRWVALVFRVYLSPRCSNSSFWHELVVLLVILTLCVLTQVYNWDRVFGKAVLFFVLL